MQKSLLAKGVALGVVAGLTACGGSSSGGSGGKGDSVGVYEFKSQFIEGESSVSYSGQTARSALISRIKAEIGVLNAQSANVAAGIAKFYSTETQDLYALGGATQNHNFSLPGNEVAAEGQLWTDISSGKNVKAKLVGQDGLQTPFTEFVGWDDSLEGYLLFSGTAVEEPDQLVTFFFEEIGRINNDISVDGARDAGVDNIIIDLNSTTSITSTVYVDKYGRDFQQLAQKFLLGGVTFHQGTADYLSIDLTSKNEPIDPADTYTEAEHKWDEAFGYFGAARDYLVYSDAQIAAGEVIDTDGDQEIALKSEVNMNNSVNCGKRDAAGLGTDLTKEVYEAFYNGRKLLNEAAKSSPADLTSSQSASLNAYAEAASVAWEKCIAATVVHYINDTVDDIDGLVNGKFENIAAFETYAKHWSEMKGFALGLQFSPYSPWLNQNTHLLKDHVLDLMGNAPVLPNGKQMGRVYTGGITQYRADLVALHDVFIDVYGFTPQQVAGW